MAQHEDRPAQDSIDLSKQRRPTNAGWYVRADSGEPVGEFRQGSAGSQWALARYLVGRAIGESIGASMLVVGLVLLAGGALLWWAEFVVLAVLVVLLALAVLGMRALLRAVLRRFTAVGQFADVEARLRALVRETRADVLRELRRIGLPGRLLTLPLLGVRLARRRRREQTLQRLRTFRVDNVVPAARLDELHMLLRTAAGGTPPPGPGSPRARS